MPSATIRREVGRPARAGLAAFPSQLQSPVNLSRVPRLATVVLLLLTAACASSIPEPKSTPGGPAATVAVQRFLQLASAKDYIEMGYVFGTAEGPIIQRDPQADVERRMYAIAQLLQHDQFVIGPENPVPGRIGDAVRLQVLLTRNGREHEVPFVAVAGPDNRWYVEQVDLSAITGS